MVGQAGKGGAAHKAERLFALTLLLLSSSRPISRDDIRERVREYDPDASEDAFEREFERDKDELRKHFEVTTVSDTWNPVPAYRIDLDRSLMPELDLTAQQWACVRAATSVWRGTAQEPVARGALAKFAVASGSDPASLAAQAPVAVAARGASQDLEALLQACGAEVATFDYRSASGEVTKRVVEPWRVGNVNGSWYVIGLDQDRGERRMFKISRIKNLKTKKGSFEVPSDVEVRFTLPVVDPVCLRVAVAPGRGNYLRGIADPTVETQQVAVSTAEGQQSWDVLSVTCDSEFAAVATIAKSGDAAKVMSPQRIAHRVVELASAAREASGHQPAEPQRLSNKRKITRNREGADVRHLRMCMLVAWLNTRGFASFDDVCVAFSIDEKTLIDDLNLVNLTEFGFYNETLDIHVDEAGRYISVHNGGKLQGATRLDLRESMVVLSGLRQLAQVEGNPLREDAVTAYGILASHLPAQVTRVVEAMVPWPQHSEWESSAVSDALRQGRQLSFDYQSLSDEVTSRTVDPVLVFSQNGVTYLKAWDHGRAAIRVFRLSRISNPTVLDAEALAHDDISPDIGVSPLGEKCQIELVPESRWLVEYLPHDYQEELAGEGLLVTLSVANPTSMALQLLPLGGAVLVHSTDEFRRSVHRAASRVLSLYA